MADGERSTVEQLQDMLDGVPSPVKMAAAAVAIIFVAWLLWTSIGGVLRNYEPIAVDSNNADKAQILEYLNSNNIDYKIEPGGMIMVPSSNADELRIEMSGLDMAVTSLDGLDDLKVGMGDTDTTISAKLRKLNERQIEEALKSVSWINGARVTLALPEKSNFLARDETPAKASIQLNLRASYSPTSQQVRGLQVNIANSVQSLNPENVSILDHNANLLSHNDDGSEAFDSIESSEEAKVREKITALFAPILGRDRLRVSATVEVTREASEIQKREIDTTMAAVTHVITSENESSGGGGIGGEPGAEPNTDGGLAAGGGAAETTSASSEDRTTEFPTTVTTTTVLPGQVKRQTVSVIIDMDREITTAEDGTETEQSISWGEQLIQWDMMIKQAIGFDGERGDLVTLTESEFADLRQQEQRYEDEQKNVEFRKMIDILDWSDWTILVKIPLLILILFAIFWYILKPIGKVIIEPILQMPSHGAAELPEELPKTVEELEAEIEGKLEDEIDLATKEVTKGTILKKRIAELAKSEPESFTQLIRTWLNE